jgi:hypothetical protein
MGETTNKTRGENNIMSATSDLKRADDVEQNWMLAKGKKELVRHLRGGRLSATEAIKAKCYECMGGYGDDKVDCEISACPLRPMMPYNPDKNKSLRVMSDKNKKAASDRMRKLQAGKKA